MKTVITVVLTVLVTLALAWLAVVGVARAGTVDVAASAEYLPGAEWFFSTLSERSIRRHAADAVEAGHIELPAEVTPAMLRSGAAHYPAMCVPCHGGPGVPRGEIGQGLKPRPPGLSQVAREMSSAEIYWVLEHGIRHTGMPAFGATHSPEELWGLTAFVEQLDGMTPEDYQRLTAEAGDAHDHGDAGHGDAAQGDAAQGDAGHGHGGEGQAADEPAQDGHEHAGDGHEDHSH